MHEIDGSVVSHSVQSAYVNEPQETWSSVSRRSLFVNVRIEIPELKTYKILRQATSETLWNLKCNLIHRMPDLVSRFSDCWNWGFLYDRAGDTLSMRPTFPKAFPTIKTSHLRNYELKVFLDDSKTFEQLRLFGEINLAFCPRFRLTSLGEKKYEKYNTKSTRKKFINYLTCQNDKKVAEMLQKGFDPNFFTDENITPLIMALRMEDRTAINFLLHFGAFVDFRVPDQKSPMHWAAQNDKAFSISVLISWGANPNILDPQGATPLHFACSKGHTECVEQLLHGQASPHAHDSAGRSPLHFASTGFPDCINLLLDAGANIHDVNSLGNTALHVAASMNEEACVLLLLQRGANKDALNLAGKTAEQMAVLGNFFNLAEKMRGFKPLPESETGTEEQEERREESPLTKSIALRPFSSAGSDYSETVALYPRKRTPAPPPPSVVKCLSPFPSNPSEILNLESQKLSPFKLALKRFHDSRLLPVNISSEQGALGSSNSLGMLQHKIQEHIQSLKPGDVGPLIQTNVSVSPLPPPPEFDFSSLSTVAARPGESSMRPTPSPLLEVSAQDAKQNLTLQYVEVMTSLSVEQLELFKMLAKKNAALEQAVRVLSRDLELSKKQSLIDSV